MMSLRERDCVLNAFDVPPSKRQVISSPPDYDGGPPGSGRGRVVRGAADVAQRRARQRQRD